MKRPMTPEEIRHHQAAVWRRYRNETPEERAERISQQTWPLCSAEDDFPLLWDKPAPPEKPALNPPRWWAWVVALCIAAGALWMFLGTPA